MSHREQEPAGPLASPWPVLGAGLALIAVGWLWGLGADATAPAMRVLALATGLIAVGSALALYLPHATADLEGRLYSGGLWLIAAAAVYLARVGLGTSFDSMQVLLQVLTLAAVLAAILTALPPGWRALGGSLLLVLHFAAILTAVTVVPPPNGPSPYVSSQLWNRMTRPWLQLTVLNNGYHFYAPEPGPAALLWFRVEFADGASTWVRIPDHPKVATHIERRRLGALATTTGQSVPISAERQDELLQKRQQVNFDRRQQRLPEIPMAESPPMTQYREPPQYIQLLVQSFARRVARTTPHPDGDDSPVKAVKVYRVDYMNPPVQHFQAGREPLDPTLYHAYYMGEHEADGTLKESSLKLIRDKDGRVTERIQDPFLYWQIPIVRVPDETAAPEVGPKQREGDPGVWGSEGRVINFVRVHAGDKKDQESIP